MPSLPKFLDRFRKEWSIKILRKLNIKEHCRSQDNAHTARKIRVKTNRIRSLEMGIALSNSTKIQSKNCTQYRRLKKFYTAYSFGRIAKNNKRFSQNEIYLIIYS